MDASVIYGLIGLFGGVLFWGIGTMLGNHFAKKKNGYDERHFEIVRHAKNLSWWISFIAMFIMFGLVILQVITSAILVMAVIYAAHMFSYSFGMFYYNFKM